MKKTCSWSRSAPTTKSIEGSPNPLLAQRLYPVEICAFVFASNHFHLLARAEDSERLARFMGYFNSKLAREVARSTGWRDKVLSRRHQAILVSDEEEAQVVRAWMSHGRSPFRGGRRSWPKPKSYALRQGTDRLISSGTYSGQAPLAVDTKAAIALASEQSLEIKELGP